MEVVGSSPTRRSVAQMREHHAILKARCKNSRGLPCLQNATSQDVALFCFGVATVRDDGAGQADGTKKVIVPAAAVFNVGA